MGLGCGVQGSWGLKRCGGFREGGGFREFESGLVLSGAMKLEGSLGHRLRELA